MAVKIFEVVMHGGSCWHYGLGRSLARGCIKPSCGVWNVLAKEVVMAVKIFEVVMHGPGCSWHYGLGRSLAKLCIKPSCGVWSVLTREVVMAAKVFEVVKERAGIIGQQPCTVASCESGTVADFSGSCMLWICLHQVLSMSAG